MKTVETLTYTNSLGESLVFSHASVYCSQTVEGISDVRNTIYSINSMGQDGDTFVANRLESRDIDISGFIKERDPDKLRAHRRKLARILNPQMSAILTYQYGSFTRVISCRSVNAPVITKPAGSIYTGFSVQLVCLNPFWREVAEKRDDIAAWIGSLEFPVDIPEGGMQIGYRQPSLIVNVYNGGDVQTGIRIEFQALGDVTDPIITNVDSQEFIRLNITLQDGDVLTLSTGYSDKWAKLYRDGVTTDALRYVDVDSTFLQLAPGDNLIRYDAEQGLSNLEVSIFHNNLYLGV
jgi:phage-related protein